MSGVETCWMIRPLASEPQYPIGILTQIEAFVSHQSRRCSSATQSPWDRSRDRADDERRIRKYREWADGKDLPG